MKPSNVALSSSIQSDDVSIHDVRMSPSAEVRSIDLPAKKSSTASDAALDVEVAIGRIFMVAAVVLFAGEMFTDESIVQLVSTTFMMN